MNWKKIIDGADFDAANARARAEYEEQSEPQRVPDLPMPTGRSRVPDLPMPIGRSIGNAARREIIANCREGESPRFIVGAGMGGVLAAFEDRCIIVKKGGLTAWGAGATGGGRVALFNYADITAIEINTGWMTCTVEILSQSHSAHHADDYWRIGKNSGRSHDPMKMPNVLSMSKKEYEQARTQIDWLREQAAIQKQTVIVANQPEAQPPEDMADQIRKLAELRDSGALTEAEFAAAKASIIERNI